MNIESAGASSAERAIQDIKVYEQQVFGKVATPDELDRLAEDALMDPTRLGDLTPYYAASLMMVANRRRQETQS